MTDTRIVFASDIHGSERTFIKFVNSAVFYKANVIIIGGDITGKLIIPIIEQPGGTLKTNFLGSDILVKEDELRLLEKKIEDTGFYACRITVDEKIMLDNNPEKVNELFSHLMIQRAKRWVDLAESRLKGINVKCFISAGNDDSFTIDKVLENSDYIIYPEGKVVMVDEDHEMISCGYSNPTPFNCPRDVSEEELLNRIEAMTSQVNDMKNCIFNFHCPPYNSQIDVAPELDASLKPVIRDGQPSYIPVGSKAVRQAIEKYQPLLGLHGHIHESKGFFNIGRTPCLNPGSEYSEGILRTVLVVLDKKKVKSYLFLSG